MVNAPHVHFNISHAGKYIVCIVSDEPVGIDIELLKSADLKIAERFFTSDETEYIMLGEQTLRFCEVWTMKESRIKREGLGLHKPLNSFSVFEPYAQERLAYHKIFQNNEAIGHVCSTKQSAPSVRLIDIGTFMKNIQF